MNFTLLLLLSLQLLQAINPPDQKNWTIMYYAAGSNSSETDLLSDFSEMKDGKLSSDYNLITLIDRINGYSNDSLTLEGNFTDSRLFKIEHHSYLSLSGKELFSEINPGSTFEANMGDATTLRKFIQYCKKYYPANYYMLVLRSHGNGVGMCPDAEQGPMDRLYPAEISKILTKDESVDILGLDVCSMAGLENLYQWRRRDKSFSADFIIASAPLSGAWAYDHILKRLSKSDDYERESESNYFGSGSEFKLNPEIMTPKEFANLIFEEIFDNQSWASWGLFDNTKIEIVKKRIDEASICLAKENKEAILKIIKATLGYYHNTSDNLEIAQLTFPYLDAYHFWYQISAHSELNYQTRDNAKEVCHLIDQLVIGSYYGQGFLPETKDFVDGSSGVYQIIPIGSKVFLANK